MEVLYTLPYVTLIAAKYSQQLVPDFAVNYYVLYGVIVATMMKIE